MFILRKIATLTYRSGPEWEKRFQSEKIPNIGVSTYHAPEFLIEDYIRHQVIFQCNRMYRYFPTPMRVGFEEQEAIIYSRLKLLQNKIIVLIFIFRGKRFYQRRNSIQTA